MATTANTSPSTANSVSGGQGGNYIPGWEAAVLGLIGAPVTQANISWLSQWHAYEQSNASNNPLNVTAFPPDPITVGLGGINSAGVQSYATASQGIQATATFLKMPNYSAILSALKSGNAYTYSQANSSSVSKALSIWGTRNNFVYIATGGAPHFGAQAGAGTGGVPAVGTAEQAVGSAATTAGNVVGSFLSDLTNPMTWLRIAEVIGGVLLVGLALYLIAKDIGLNPPKPPGPLGSASDEADELANAFDQGQRQGRLAAARAEGRRQSGATVSGSETPQSERFRRIRERADTIPDEIPY